MDGRTTATRHVEGVRQVAEGARPRETISWEEARRKEPRAASPSEQRTETTIPVFREFRYRVDESTGRIVVEIRDGLTGELVRQVPPEEILQVMRGIQEYLGIRVDRRA
ncbi:flagellar protein FlaG [Limnochorda pilosa]|uniref:Flagellar protein FlaG n=1 Tax=Limnochorda pilosa TaxID=1555112 RepID=A0A0K2SPP4_LIMPI|nr:flagellar protein FlaG [Limnochorda pilosa]BAS28794.1 hypothetical protein LIP_2965 [Limnochorda pilosa]